MNDFYNFDIKKHTTIQTLPIPLLTMTKMFHAYSLLTDKNRTKPFPLLESRNFYRLFLFTPEKYLR